MVGKVSLCPPSAGDSKSEKRPQCGGRPRLWDFRKDKQAESNGVHWGAQEWRTAFRVGKRAGKMRTLDQPQLGTVLARIRMHTSLYKAKAVLPQHRLHNQ